MCTSKKLVANSSLFVKARNPPIMNLYHAAAPTLSWAHLLDEFPEE